MPELWSEAVTERYKEVLADLVFMRTHPAVMTKIEGREVKYVVIDDIASWDDAWSDSSSVNAG